MVDASDLPVSVVFMQVGDAVVVNLMGKAFIGVGAQCALDLGEDDPEMSYCDDAAVLCT